jgi:ATP-binding cassette subfamily A (ABC1) protein 3
LSRGGCFNFFNYLYYQSYPKILSGGMRRKLCLALALIGNPKFIILDEPTAGVDPGARLFIRNLLRKFRKDHTMILSTHYMDEADFLCDRVAILIKGVIKAYGTPFNLKRQINIGQLLFLARDVSSEKASIDTVTSFVQKHVSSAVLLRGHAGELVYSVPTNIDDPDLLNLLDSLEENKSKYGISGFGISEGSLENVFLKLVQEEKNSSRLLAQTTRAISGSRTNDLEAEIDALQVSSAVAKKKGFPLAIRHLNALLYKKFLYTKNDLGAFFLQLLLPIILLVVMGITNSSHNASNLVSLPSSTDKLPGLIISREPALFYNPFVKEFLRIAKEDSALEVTTLLSEEGKIKTQIEETLIEWPGIFTKFPAAISFKQNAGTVSETTIFYNSESPILPHELINFYNNLCLRALLPSESHKKFEHFLTGNIVLSSEEKQNFTDSSSSFPFKIAVAFVTSGFIILVIKEKVNNSKHLQLLAGVHPIIYWSSFFLWDFVITLIMIVLITLIVFLLKYLPSASVGQFILFMVIYMPTMLSSMYVFSFMFNSPISGYSTLLVGDIVVSHILLAFFHHLPHESALYLFSVFPPFSFLMVLQDLLNPSQKADFALRYAILLVVMFLNVCLLFFGEYYNSIMAWLQTRFATPIRYKLSFLLLGFYFLCIRYFFYL